METETNREFLEKAPRQVLRQATQPHHKRIEAQLNLTRPDMTLESYIHLLKRYLAFYAEIEKRLTESDLIGAKLDWSHRVKTPLLKEDLKNLGIDSEVIETCPDVPTALTKGELFGILYVLEGSTLGAQVLSKHFEQLLGVTPQKGGRFFFGHGAETGKFWQEFVQLLDQECTEKAEQEAAIRLACRTFDRLGEWASS